jgi:hypothetical protein
MTSPVIVYPTHVDVTPSQPNPLRTADRGNTLERGQRVRWYYTDAMPEPDCAYCNDGRCEQRVEWSAMWTREVVAHDRPRWVQ